MAKVMYINNDGGGFADHVEINDGETIESFLRRKGVTDFSNYNIRVNSNTVTSAQVLSDGDRVQAIQQDRVLNDNDRVTVTPKNVAGAIRHALEQAGIL